MATLLLPVEFSASGVTAARRELDKIESQFMAGTATRAATTPQQPEIVTVDAHARAIPYSRTPELLELFARQERLLTPEEIGVEMGRGQPLGKASGRAFVRNLSRMQGNLIKRGRISRPVLLKDFDRYEQEGAGRYGLSASDRAALRAHLGI